MNQPMGSPYGSMGGPPAPNKSNTNLILIIVVGAVFGGLMILGILGALAYSGMRRYLSASKMVEGRVNVVTLAGGLAACAQKSEVSVSGEVTQRGLPPSSGKVPASLAQVKGKRYASSPADWSDDAFKCASFTVATPHYFQYQWELTTPALGTVRAQGDLDGDGVAEITIEQDVRCSDQAGDLTCDVGPMREK
jgi:hypothetical protein